METYECNDTMMYAYIEKHASEKQMTQTLQVLPYAKELHKDQFRKGEKRIPYIWHPLSVASHGIALGLDEDDMISAAILHDICEDCGVKVEELPVNDATKEAVRLLTKTDIYYRGGEDGMAQYYDGIVQNPLASIVKLLDRCNNVSSMAKGFTKAKMAGYIQDTERWFYPMFEKVRTNFPEYADQVYLIQYHMTSVVEAIKSLL